MSLILARRYQQGMYQTAAATNRLDSTAGMGAGQGIASQPTQGVHGGAANNAAAFVVAGAVTDQVITDGTGSPMAITVNADRASNWLFAGTLLIEGPTAGTTSAALVVPWLDGLNTLNYLNGLNGSEMGFKGGGATERATITVFYPASLAAGVHLLEIRITIGPANSYNIFSFDLYAFQMN